jgi:hypothetical protein
MFVAVFFCCRAVSDEQMAKDSVVNLEVAQSRGGHREV